MSWVPPRCRGSESLTPRGSVVSSARRSCQLLAGDPGSDRRGYITWRLLPFAGPAPVPWQRRRCHQLSGAVNSAVFVPRPRDVPATKQG
ncbi:hypothetical protein GJAV_G00256510 [Gymnothorax javanicus]|nr:hypothetical protein GJAV_G00256510 [Gymnothorax javanicus]